LSSHVRDLAGLNAAGHGLHIHLIVWGGMKHCVYVCARSYVCACKCVCVYLCVI